MTSAELNKLADELDSTAAPIRRLIQGAFRRDGERLPEADRPRFSIPCRPDHDDDTFTIDTIQQVAAALRARATIADADGGK